MLGSIQTALGSVPTASEPTGGTGGSFAADWREAMFNTAQGLYDTIGADFMIDFDQGSAGFTGGGPDYQLGPSPNASLNNAGQSYLTTVNGGAIQMDSGAVTVNGTINGVVGKGNPTMLASLKNGAPSFWAARARLDTLQVAGGQSLPITATQINSFSLGAPALGQIGSASLGDYGFTDGVSNFDTGVPIVLSTFIDLAFGFDGVTLQSLIGLVLKGTLAKKTSSTNLAGLSVSAAQPGAIMTISGTTRQLFTIEKLYCAYALTA